MTTLKQNIGRIISGGFKQSQAAIDRKIRRIAKYKARLREKKINSILNN